MHPDVCGYVVKGVRRLQMQMDLSDVVTGSVVELLKHISTYIYIYVQPA